jgi:hypothetical protein
VIGNGHAGFGRAASEKDPQGHLADVVPRPGTNLTAADTLYVVLAEQLGASLLTDDHRSVQAPTFPAHVPVLRLPASL